MISFWKLSAEYITDHQSIIRILVGIMEDNKYKSLVFIVKSENTTIEGRIEQYFLLY